MQSIFQRVLTPVAPIVLGKSPPRVFSAAVVHSVKTANRMPSNDQSNQLPIMKLRSCWRVDSNQIMEPGRGQHRARSFRIDQQKSKRLTRGDVLRANRRLVRVALCRHVCHFTGVSVSGTIIGQIGKAWVQLEQLSYDAVALAGMKVSGSSNRSLFRNSCRRSKRLTHI